MITEIDSLVKNLNDNIQIRQTLSQIRALIKEDGPKQYFINAFAGKEDVLIGFLNDEDPKTRKNAALLLGDIAQVLEDDSAEEKCMQALYEAYIKEDKLFVKGSYLLALKNYDYRQYLEPLKHRKEELSKMDCAESDIKHVNEELHALDSLIITMEGLKKHTFTGGHVMSDIVLLTNRKNVDVIANQVAEVLDTDIDDDNIKIFLAGVIVHTDRVSEIMKIRTYSEMLYQVKGMVGLPNDPTEAAKRVAKSSIMEFLEKRHNIENKTPMYFRIEMKSNMDLATKSAFVKKMSYEIEKNTDNRLVNNKSNYEIEIRLIETKTGKFNCLVKLYTQKDDRFNYRKRSVAASIKPENAALIVELAKEYMVDNAKVLDPFCGTGTLLIERQKNKKANTSYGIDIYGEAIEGAKINTEAADQIIHYINKDYFEFEHEYLFDEIITDMPFETGHKEAFEIGQIYKKFFVKAKQNLTQSGRIIMYTHNKELVTKYAKEYGYRILMHKIILEKAKTDLYVLQID